MSFHLPIFIATFMLLCGCGSLFSARHDTHKRQVRRLKERIEELADENWALGESADRFRSLLESHGDLIVRRAADGKIIYANEAFCRVIGKTAEDIVGTICPLQALEQRGEAMLEDGTRVYDQKLATPSG